MGHEAINEEAEQRYGGDFLCFRTYQQELCLKQSMMVSRKPPRIFGRGCRCTAFWQVIMGDAIDAYYAHPWAWDEIGFGGPAYPRAYTRSERGEPEPWEVEEQRYEWLAPAGTAVSHEVESAAHHHTEADQPSIREGMMNTEKSQCWERSSRRTIGKHMLGSLQ